MRRGKGVAPILLVLTVTLAAVRQAYGYIDPGTTSSMFALLAPLVSVFALFLGYALWPFRKVLWSILRKKKDVEDSGAEPANDKEGS